MGQYVPVGLLSNFLLCCFISYKETKLGFVSQHETKSNISLQKSFLTFKPNSLQRFGPRVTDMVGGSAAITENLTFWT